MTPFIIMINNINIENFKIIPLIYIKTNTSNLIDIDKQGIRKVEDVFRL